MKADQLIVFVVAESNKGKLENAALNVLLREEGWRRGRRATFCRNIGR